MSDLKLFIIYIIFNSFFVFIISPFFMSLIKKIKAFCQRRIGPPLFQPYYNLFKLMKKRDYLFFNIFRNN